MWRVFFAIIFVFFLLPNCFAEGKIPVLIIDSGTDFTHPYLKIVADPDPDELKGKPGIDDSGSGFIDDIYGWNFLENSNILVRLEYAPRRYNDVIRYMALHGLYQQVGKDGMDPDDFYQYVVLYFDKELQPWISFFGGWAHGTHVAGIVADNNPYIKMKGITYIYSGIPPQKELIENLQKINFMITQDFNLAALASEKKQRALEDSPLFPILVSHFKELGELRAAEEAKGKLAGYMSGLKPRVVNCSFGSSNNFFVARFKEYMVKYWGYANPSDRDVQELVNLYVTHVLIPRDVVLYSGLKDALIVISSGNDAANNDELVLSPKNIPFSNTLVVGATDRDIRLANFSNYGKESVDVAVPGVNILSAAPKGRMAAMSGTSMAAPLAAKYASLVFGANNELTPENVKKILMETVDKKTWLTEKVKSGGVINIKRAVEAARQVKAGKSLDEAIANANQQVPTIEVPHTPAPEFRTDFEKELYNSAIF
ncbi:S8 family serine peptidase [Candidatus Riflebacteria bacterium]